MRQSEHIRTYVAPLFASPFVYVHALQVYNNVPDTFDKMVCPVQNDNAPNGYEHILSTHDMKGIVACFSLYACNRAVS